MPSLLFILPICTYICVCMYVQVSAMLRSRQAESGVSGPGPDLQAPASSSLVCLRAAVPPVLHAPCLAPPPPACLCEICAKYQPGPACPPHAWLSESQAGLSLLGRGSPVFSLSLAGRAGNGQRLIRLRPVPPLIYRARHHRQQLNPSLNIPNSKLPILSWIW